MNQVLIIDDDPGVCKTLKKIIASMGYATALASSLAEGLQKASQAPWDVVFLDVNLPDGNGIAAIDKFKKAPSSPEVIILTGNGTSDAAEIAIKSGAWDFLEKPIRVNAIRLPLKRVFQFRKEKVGPTIANTFKRDRIVGNSLELRRCLESAARAAAGTANVLITGETGTGKELFARAIHENSARCDKAFVVVDCASLPETLIESILFGHKKGAFTGADKNREGLIAQADGGTLFLDEVTEMPLANQRRFLRVLQEKQFRPVGGNRKMTSNFRLIGATNRDVDQMVQKGTFREDLYFRLRALEIGLPPLRKRLESLNDLALWAVRRYCKNNQMETIGFLPEFLEALQQYRWPGNVREYISAIEAAVSNAQGENVLHPIHLPLYIRAKIAGSSVKNRTASGSSQELSATGLPASLPTFTQFREASEKQYLQDLLSRTRGDIKASCHLSALSRAQLYRLLKKHGIQKEHFT